MLTRKSAAAAAAFAFAATLFPLTPVAQAAYFHPPAAWVKIVNAQTGKCMDIKGAATGSWADVHQWTCLPNAANQQWAFVDVGDNTFRISSRHSLKCLTDGNSLTQDTCYVDTISKTQVWRIAVVDGGLLKIMNRASGECPQVSGGSPADGAFLYTAPCTTVYEHDPKQLWYIQT